MATKSILLAVATLVLAAVGDPGISINPLANITDSTSSISDDVTASMEAAIKNLMMGKTAFGATPMGGSVKKIKDLLTKTMMPKVLAAHKSDQNELNKLAKDIAKCGSIRDNAIKGAAPSQKKYKSNSRLHKACRRDEAVKLTSLRTCRREEKSLLQIKNLKCNYFATLSKQYGSSKNNNVIVRKGGGESVLSYITRLSQTICGDHIHCAKGQCSKPGGWGGGLPNGFLDKYLRAKHACEVATKNYNEKVKECKRKQRAYNIKKAKCDQYQVLMDSSSCKHAVIMKDGCEAYSECYFTKVKIYKQFEKTVRMEERDRKAEWRGLKRMSCLMNAFADGKVTNAEVDACKKKTHSTALLNIKYPKIPPLIKCPIPRFYPSTPFYKRAEFQPLPTLAKGKPSVECSGVKEIETKPRTGSPKQCKCRRVALNGPYSSGAIVKCSNCHDVHRSSQKGSCPRGTKIFSPRSRLDWTTFIASAKPLRAPNWIVDVTRPQNGCGGCTYGIMNSGNSRQKTWRTTDGSPWWLRSKRYNEPNGDYSANCYLDLWHTPRNSDSVTFNDGRCNYHAKSYYCQSKKLGIKPAPGAPKSCKCSKVEVTGSYSAGLLVKCEQCVTVYRSTQKNSCPIGMKIFSPRSRADWKVFLDSAGPLRAPHWIIDITRPQNGCGGCTRYSMKSTTPQQATWRTSDGSAWWLRNSRYNEPNGDYTGNCYMDLWRPIKSENAITFNDARCHYRSRSYYCQPKAKPKPKPKPAPAPMPRNEAQARVYCSSLGWLVQSKPSSGAIICSKPKRNGVYGNCDSCSTWRLIVFKNGGTDQAPGGQKYPTKSGHFYCGHKPCRGGWNLPYGGLWNAKKAGGSLKFIDVVRKYPQPDIPVGSYCPKGSNYVSHACGTGALKWTMKLGQKVQWGPYKQAKAMLNNKYKAHCYTSCNCNTIRVACQTGTLFIDVKKKYPQNAYVGSFCPAGTNYVKHACGTGADKWTGTQKVQWGPYSNNAFMDNKRGKHCYTSCNCNKVRVQCQAGGGGPKPKALKDGDIVMAIKMITAQGAKVPRGTYGKMANKGKKVMWDNKYQNDLSHVKLGKDFVQAPALIKKAPAKKLR